MNELNENPENKLQPGAEPTSKGERATSQIIPETLTREEAQRLIHNAETAVGSKLGRELKAARLEVEQYKSSQSKLESELNETRERMREVQRRIDEDEEEEARGSPESLKLYQRQKQLRELEAKLNEGKRQLEKERTEHASELANAKEGKIEMAIISAAVEHHIDIGKLKEKCQRFNLTTEEQISEMAETLAEQAQTGEDNKKKIPQGNSGATIGGGSDILREMYPTHYK